MPRRLKEPLLIVLSAALLVIPYHFGGAFVTAFFGLVPFFFVIHNRSSFSVFKWSMVFGFIFYALLGYWLNYVNVLGFIVLALYLALYFGLFGLYASGYLTYSKRRNAFFIAAIWVLLEYIRSVFLSGFPWALLSYSQWKNIPFIQMADLVGPYGVSFIVVSVNVFIYQTLKVYTAPPNLLRRDHPVKSFSMIALIITVALGYGFMVLHERDAFYASNSPKARLKLAVLQGNIPQEQKWDNRIKNIIFEKYKRLTLMAALEKSDLVIWPETSFPGFLEDEPLMAAHLRGVARQSTTHVLVGAPTLSDIEVEQDFRSYNSAVLYTPKGEESARYKKMHLVPFGEYVPFESVIGIIRKFVSIGHFTAGTEQTIFSVVSRFQPGVIAAKFGVSICYEDIFPSMIREMCQNGADFMVNITNDAWFGKTSAPYQHAQASVFRAVENRIPVVRAANTGLSCFITAEGRIVASVKHEGKEIMVSGHKSNDIILRKGRPLYTKIGDIFFWINCLILFAAYRDRQKQHSYARI